MFEAWSKTTEGILPRFCLAGQPKYLTTKGIIDSKQALNRSSAKEVSIYNLRQFEGIFKWKVQNRVVSQFEILKKLQRFLDGFQGVSAA